MGTSAGTFLGVFLFPKKGGTTKFFLRLFVLLCNFCIACEDGEFFCFPEDGLSVQNVL